MGLRLKFNLMLAGVFLLGLVASSFVFYEAARQNARDQIRGQIEVLRAQALAVRSYTAEEIRPLLTDLSDIQFLPQTVPSWSAQTTFRNFQDRYPNFFYKEAALNPTNPADLAEDWEATLIEQLRADPALDEIVIVREDEKGADQFTVAFPLTIRNEGCLTCHSTPDRAPASMVALYGDKGGFGWQLNETIGAQIFSVPLQIAEDQAWDSVKWLIVSMTAIFVVTLGLLNLLLSSMVIRPVTRMAHIAEQVSLGDSTQPEYIHDGKDEIASLSQSFNRMRRSLDNALKMLDE